MSPTLSKQRRCTRAGDNADLGTNVQRGPRVTTIVHGTQTKGYTAMTINFECKKCRNEFARDVGKIGIDHSGMRPTFSKDIVCPRCGKLTMDDVLLTKLGQTQMTAATMGL